MTDTNDLTLVARNSHMKRLLLVAFLLVPLTDLSAQNTSSTMPEMRA